MRAGERPWEVKGTKQKTKKRRHGLAKFVAPARRVITIALVVGGLVSGVYEPFRTKVNDTYTSAKDKVMNVIHPKFDRVTPGPGTASTTPPIDPAHPAERAIDGFKNTY